MFHFAAKVESQKIQLCFTLFYSYQLSLLPYFTFRSWHIGLVLEDDLNPVTDTIFWFYMMPIDGVALVRKLAGMEKI